MLDAETNTYLPISSSGKIALISLILGFFATIFYLVFRYFRKRIAMHRQEKLLKKKLVNQTDVVAEALAKLDQIAAQAQAGQLTVALAAYSASQTTRHYFDILMNQHTSYATKTELRELYLDKLVSTLDTGYPLEFDTAHAQVSTVEQLLSMVVVSKEVISSCN